MIYWVRTSQLLIYIYTEVLKKTAEMALRIFFVWQYTHYYIVALILYTSQR